MGKRKGSREKVSAEATLAARFGAAQPPLGATAWLAPMLVFACLMVLYVVTLAPSVMGGDSGELTAAALTDGVPHPPGYPLFALLARLFALLPFGHSPAWRVSLLSAVSTAAATGLLCAVVQLWTRNLAAGVLAAALFGTDSVVWLNALAAEVFGLNAMFVALAFLLWLLVETSRNGRYALALAFCCGLAMCNHHTFAFVGAPLLGRSIWLTRRELSATGILAAVGFGILGLLPYAYLVHASGSSAAVSWGDQTSFDGLLAHVMRRSYGTLSLGRTSANGAFVEEGTFFPTLWHMVGHAAPRLLWVAPILFFLSIRRSRSKGAVDPIHVLLAVLCSYIVPFCLLSNLSTQVGLYRTVLQRFIIQSDCMIAIASGLGFARLSSWAARRARTPRLPYGLAVGCAVVAFGFGVLFHAAQANQRNNRIFADFVGDAFASLPPKAIVITMGDHLTGSVFYFREVEKLRPDVIHLDRELLGFAWYEKRQRRLHPDLYLPGGVYGKSGWKIKEFLEGNPGRPLVVIDRLDDWDRSWKDGYKLATNGLVHPVVPASEFPSFHEWKRRDQEAMAGYDVLPALRASEGSWENALGQLALTAEGARAHLALVYSHDAGNALEPAQYSLALLEDVIAKAGGDDGLRIKGTPGLRRLTIASTVFRDIGIAYEIVSRAYPGYAHHVALAYRRFVETAAASDPDLAAARHYVETHPLPTEWR